MEIILNQKSEFADLMSKIIASDLPEDNETWTIGRDYFVDMVFNEKDIRNTIIPLLATTILSPEPSSTLG